MNYTQSPYLQHDVHIYYIYYEVIGRSETAESLMHSIHYNKIIECLEDKNYILHKEDIIYLLKDDGAHFYEDSLRIYDSTEDTYFQVTDDWEMCCDDAEPSFSLLFYIKSTNPNIRKKLDDFNEDIKQIKQTMNSRLDNLEDRVKSTIEAMSNEINKLKFSTQVLFRQLARMYKDQAITEPEELSSQTEKPKEATDAECHPEKGEICVPRRPGPIFDYNRKDIKSHSQDIDIALMYSEPLVKKDEYGIMSLGDPVDYEEECSKVLEILRKKEKKINVYFEIATIRHLVNVLSLSPTALHIICHGDFNRAKNQFYLCFEENGELSEVYSGDLRTRLQAVNFSTKLVFINACHSEEVARVFMEAGVPCVVAVHSELKIEDSIAQRFAESFYWQLFEGKTISEAFRHARAAIAGKDVYTCCCAHSHDPKCKWYKLAKEQGFEKAHHLHTPTCTDCAIKFGNRHYHKDNCIWALDFLTSICEHEEFPAGPMRACCCSPHLEHNEVMKFKLISSEKRFQDEVLFRYKEKGEVTIKSSYSCVERKFATVKITGRNRETYEIFSLLTSKEQRIVNLNGLEGVGKTTLVKQVANYLVERGYYSKDKACILMLEKTPSITYFRSNLFKEVPGSYDLKSFCASVGATKMLFILLKCDKLISEYYDQFRQDLAFIMEYATNVKFLVVTNSKVELALGESHVLMKELKKLDAAKLVCKNAYLYLPWDMRNVYNLCEHGVFDLVPLTPQGLWSIVEKLKENNSLDDIEAELLMEKEKSDGDSPKNEVDGTVHKIIGSIQESNPEAYNLLIFICLFPSGLSYHDLEEMSGRGWISANWKEILLSFLKKKCLSNQYQHQPFLEDIETDCEGSSKDRKEKKIEQCDFKPDNYIWMNVTRDLTTNETWFLPTQFIIRYAEKYLKKDFYKQNFNKFEYMALLSLGLIDKIKKNHDYDEKLMEFSSVSNYGLWKLPEMFKYSVLQEDPHIHYIENSDYEFSKLKEWFAFHEPNFFSCLDLETLNEICTQNHDHLHQFAEVMEILCLTIPTLFKILSPGETKGAMEAARRAEQAVKRLGKENIKVSKSAAKLSLFLVAMYLGSKRDIAENFSLAKIQLKLTQEEEENIRDEEVSLLLSSEIAFATAMYYYWGFKNNYLNVKEFPNKHSVYKEIGNLLNKAEKVLEPLLDNDESFRVAKAKITLAEYKIKYNQRSIEKKYFEDLKESLEVFRRYGATRLLMKAHYSYASLRLELERKKINPRNVENSIDYIRQMTAKLVELKNHHLMKVALFIAQRINDKSYESKIKKKIDEINMEIRNRYFNVIIIMRAVPIVDIKSIEGTESNLQVVPIGFPTRLASSFKANLMDALSNYNKVLCMKFGILTRKELIDSLRSGCRVLQLNCNYVEPEYLCVEGQNGVVDRISFEELQQIFSTKATGLNSPRDSVGSQTTSLRVIPNEDYITHYDLQSRGPSVTSLNQFDDEIPSFRSALGDSVTNFPAPQVMQIESRMLDVLILGVKNNRSLANLFVDLGIPHIITFEFISNEANFRMKSIEDEFVDGFCIHFYEELVSQKSVAEAFELAYNQVCDYLSQKYFEEKPRNYLQSVIGQGAILLPHNGDHSEELFSSSRFPLPNGSLEDISSTAHPTNIEKMFIPFTDRSRDVHEVIKKINEFGFLEVKGAPGAGKTAFVLQLGYYALNRNLFPDGIFYIPFKIFKQKAEFGYHISDLLWETIGLDMQLGFQSFFKGKHLLLIFDDFDLFYQNEFEFPRLFFHTLKECKIPCIIVTKDFIPQVLNGDGNGTRSEGSPQPQEDINRRREELKNGLFEKDSTWELRRFSEEELAYILQSLIEGNENKDFISLEDLKACQQIKEAQGNPKYVVEKLLHGEVQINSTTLKPYPPYEKFLRFEERYLKSEENYSTPSLSKYPSSITEVRLQGRGQSLMESDTNQSLRKNSSWTNGRNGDELTELYRTPSLFHENVSQPELIKTLSNEFKNSKKGDKFKKLVKQNKQKKRIMSNLMGMVSPVVSSHTAGRNLHKMRSPPIISETSDDSQHGLDLEFDPAKEGRIPYKKMNSDTNIGYMKSILGGAGRSKFQEEKKSSEEKEGIHQDKENEENSPIAENDLDWEPAEENHYEGEEYDHNYKHDNFKMPGRIRVLRNGRRKNTIKGRKINQ